MQSDNTMGLRLLALALLVASVGAAPFPAHLVVGGGGGVAFGGSAVQGDSDAPGTFCKDSAPWQEYPVELNPSNVSGAYKPILPGTDHGLYNEGFFEGDIVRTNHVASLHDPDTKNAVTDPNLLWPSAAVVYKVDDDVGCPESPQCAILMAAMDHYHQHTCIRFKQWTGEDNWVSIFFNSDSSGACWSPVGRVGDGEQRLSLGQRCWYKGIVIHELGHAIGFWHEMNRPDRDDWIYVYWQNIVPGFSSAFRKHQAVATLGEHFDYHSIMMYDEYAFSKDGRSPTLQATTGEEIGPIWKKKGLSASDKRRIEKLYKCDPQKPKPGFPYDVNCDFNRHVCGFKNGGSANWNWRTVNQTDGYVYTSFDTAGTTPGHFMSINFPPISNAMESVRGELGCVRFYYLIETDGDAQLILDQAYLRKMTQLTHDEDATFELWSNDTSSNEWIHMEIPLYVTRPFKLIFSSSFNSTATHGTIALDDVELLYTPCSPMSTTTPASTTSAASTSTYGDGDGGSPSSTSSTPILPSTPFKGKPPKPTSTSTTTTPSTPPDVETEDTSASSTTATATEVPTFMIESTTSGVFSMTTAESEEAIQQMQLQQQQTILQAQQLLEQQQQKEQQQQLLAMSQHLQQHVDHHTSKHNKHHKQGHDQDHAHDTTPGSQTESTTFPSYQTVSGTDGQYEFPISLSHGQPEDFPVSLSHGQPEDFPVSLSHGQPEDFPVSLSHGQPEDFPVSLSHGQPEDVPMSLSHGQPEDTYGTNNAGEKVPNLPTPSEQIPMQPTSAGSAGSASSYDVDESIDGR